MEHAGVKAAKCDPSEVSDSRRASVLQLCARLPLICCQHHSALLSQAAGRKLTAGRASFMVDCRKITGF